MTTIEAKDKLHKARAGLVLSQPFFASLALRLTMQEDADCETLWTDGKTIGYNPQYVDELTLDECKGVLCHEVMHCANAHHTRREGREPGKWNQACDYAINGIIQASGLSLPKGALFDPSLSDKAAEEIYRLLPDEEDGEGGEDPGKCGEVRDGKSEEGQTASPSDLQQQEQDWKIATGQAAQLAKSQGSMPAGLDRMIQDILQPVIDWKSTLRRFVEQSAKSDYTWTRPNRRYIGEGLYLPSLHSEELPPIVIAVDTSGSVDQSMIDQFQAEITAILEDFKTSAVVLYVDTEVANVEEFTQDDLPLVLHPKGGGGTAFGPAFDYVNEHDIQASCLIYLTDMQGSFPDEEPCYPVLWVATDEYSSSAPFGETIRLK